MRKFLLILSVLLSLLLVAVFAGWWAMRSSLATLDGDVALPGLAAPVRIERDRIGTATITAANERDAMRALGFVHAQERFFEMDLMRRSAAGELAELFGPRALELDREHRKDRLRARVAANLDAALGDHHALAQAYTDGVNAGLRALHARPWAYVVLRKQPAPWRLEDTPLSAYAMYYDLQDASGKHERLLARVRPHLPPALFALITHAGSSWDAPLTGGSFGDAVLPGAVDVDLHALARLTAPVAANPQRAEVGSNNFAVGGALTSDGRAILANDMHLKLRAPNLWFRARLRYADPRAPGGAVDVSGFSLPGIPGVTVGSNGHVAWGFTNSYGDWVDWLRIPNCTPRACAARHVEHARIDVAGQAPVALDLPESSWGPIEQYDAGDGSALARRWVAHLPGALNMGLLDMARASSVDDALRVADHTAIPEQNLALADSSGRVAWRLLGLVPQRAAGCDASGISLAATCPPWSASTAAAPAIVDPSSHRIWSANARVVNGEALARIGDGGYVTAVRAHMIRDDLFAKPRFNERDLVAIQLDDRTVFLQRWWSLLQREGQHAAPRTAIHELALAAPTLEPHASANAVGYRIARAWRQSVHDRIRDALLAPARAALGRDAELPEVAQLEGIAWPLVAQQPANLLPARYASWQALFEDAAREVRGDLAPLGPLRERTWGERNTAAICHPLAAAIPLARRQLCMPAEPLDGDTLMPRAQGPDFGASERMVVAPGHEAQGIVHMPGGQSGNPLSPFWGAGHEDWVHGRATPFLPGPAMHLLRLQPVSAH